ncbi:MAG: sigma-54-dependent Fis family transcriptional regulator [Bdellovibrionales bacterium]|nr:sigma-54-dependent Fis family transcriptional regulator [Bdellovibrionales bacterium]
MKKNHEIKILVIDDEKAIRNVLSDSLKDDGYNVELAVDGEDGLLKLSDFKPDIVLLDIWMPGRLDGLEVLKQAKIQHPSVQFIIMSGHGTIETAVKATKFGAWDFVEKPLSLDKISILIHNILSYQSEKKEKGVLLNRLRSSIAIIGDSAPIVKLKQMIARVAPTESWVLISGENGTGKELVAQNIHYLSSRASKTFVEVNCAAIPKDLIESELFGYEKGAFTGADKTKLGKFDYAQGGTLFLDEIGDMSLDAQAKLLRILQERKFQRVGGLESIYADVRIVAATNKNLEEEIRKGSFREDLYYRLNVVPFSVPNLRDRLEDIPVLIDHFSVHFSRQGGFDSKIFNEQAMKMLSQYAWPGNVRELKNFVERVYILTPGPVVTASDIQYAGLNIEINSSLPEGLSFREARAKFEKEFLVKMIEDNNGNITKTAEKVGLERSYLHRKIKSFGLDIN